MPENEMSEEFQERDIFQKTIWWEVLDDIATEDINTQADIDESINHVLICVIDEDDWENERTDRIFLKARAKFDEMDSLEYLLGKKEIDELKEGIQEDSIEVVLYLAGWAYITSFKKPRENLEESLD
jgi:hypothetical protein